MRSPCFLLGQHFQGDYFFFHHTAGDNMIVLDSDQMDRASAVVAVCLALSLCLSVSVSRSLSLSVSLSLSLSVSECV